MGSTVLIIPKHVNAGGLVPFLDLLAGHAADPDLEIDFSELQRVSPAGLAALAAFVSRRTREGLLTAATGMEDCSIRDYLSRMNLPRHCGWEENEGFRRHDSVGRFVPLEPITHQVDDLGDRIAECIAPGGEDYEHPNANLYDTAWYLITEMANNVHQHSGGIGFVAAQTTPADGFVRIAIADGGMGIPGSIKKSGLPWAGDLSDEDIIEQAMVARVSSKGQPSNEGVGLTLSSRIVELMGGHMLVTSLGGTVIRSRDAEARKSVFEGGRQFPGTLVAMTFQRSEAGDFADKLQRAKELDIPLRDSPHPATFQP